MVLDKILDWIACIFIVCTTPVEVQEPSEPEPPPAIRQIVPSEPADAATTTISIPDRCSEYIPYFNLAGNPSLFAAQIDQESTCRTFAKSPYAYGIAQITPATGKTWSFTICKDLGPYKKYDDHWQLTCAARAMWQLEHDVKYNIPYCEVMSLALGKYNGGYWIIWEYEHSGHNLHISRYNVCGKVRLPNGKKRAPWACDENYEYALERIFNRQRNFVELGGQICFK